MILRLSFFILISLNFLFAQDIIFTKKNINYKEKIEIKNLTLKRIKNFRKYNCKPVTLDYLNKKTYYASHYMRKGSVVCEKDLKIIEKKSIVFDFGNLVIEKEGKMIFENKDYIKIKKLNGKIEKIYKDGRIK